MKLILAIISHIFLLLFSNCALAESAPIILDDINKIYEIGQNVEYLIDNEHKYTVNDLLTPEMQQKFTKSNSPGMFFGFSMADLWFKFKIINKTGKNTDWYLMNEYPYIYEFDLFEKNSLSFEKASGGLLNHFKDYEFSLRDVAIKIKDLPATEKLFIFKVNNQLSTDIYPKILTKNMLQHKDHTKQMILFLYIGIMLSMVIYNLFLFLSTRIISYFYLICSILCFLIYFMCSEGIITEIFYLKNMFIYNIVGIYSVTLTCISVCFFSIKFFEEYIHRPQTKNKFLALVDKYTSHTITLLKLAALFFSFFLILVFILPYEVCVIALNVLCFFTTCILLIFALSRYIGGCKGAKYYFLAWGFFFCGVALYNCKVMGWLPAENFFFTYGVNIGATGTVLILSFALADRINTEKLEKEKAQLELVESQKRAMQEQLENERKIEAAKIKAIGDYATEISDKLNSPLSSMKNISAYYRDELTKTINIFSFTDKLDVDTLITAIQNCENTAADPEFSTCISKIINYINAVRLIGTIDPVIMSKTLKTSSKQMSEDLRKELDKIVTALAFFSHVKSSALVEKIRCRQKIFDDADAVVIKLVEQLSKFREDVGCEATQIFAKTSQSLAPTSTFGRMERMKAKYGFK